MKKRILFTFAAAFSAYAATGMLAQNIISKESTQTVIIKNNGKTAETDFPVALKINNAKIKGITVWDGKKEVPSQCDDLDRNGTIDELAFVTNLKPGETKTFILKTSSVKLPDNRYKARVYAELLMKNDDKSISKVTEASSPTGDLYNKLHHHGPAFESELMAYRIYFDQKQTIDLYGKYKKQLEVEESQWYPTDAQLAKGFGDDILKVGGSVGIGTLKGWDGNRAIHITPVSNRQALVLATGPVRTVVEMNVTDWEYQNRKIDLKSRYILYAGHRDAEVYNTITKGDAKDLIFCTGVQKMPVDTMKTDNKNWVAMWGTDFPVNDTIKYGKQTVGLAVDIPSQYIVKTAKDKVNYLFLLKTDANNQINYRMTVYAQKETFGVKTAPAFFNAIKRWNESLQKPQVIIKLK
ncbi:DUF4861 domain-containing protein [Parabacteroides sp. FAFU027]|uniref:DUF4861 domain-containing protein n=1 Tax=Parabacteroides sp. FAFU027 TaxID=2922715 RepID=UPI001FAF689E|nr:DUF4861 domain-containing protein [Parabacteroides sp. FAFU027]